MTRYGKAAVGAMAIVLAGAPLASAMAGGYGSPYGKRHHYGHRHYGNPLYPIAGAAAAVVGAAAAVVALPFAILGAAAAQAPAYYPPAPAPRSYYPPQASVRPSYGAQAYGPTGYGSPAYGAPPAHYPAPAASNAYVPPPAPASYPQRAPYDAPRYPQYGDFDDYGAPAPSNGYFRHERAPGARYYASRPGPYGSPYADDYSYDSPNQR